MSPALQIGSGERLQGAEVQRLLECLPTLSTMAMVSATDITGVAPVKAEGVDLGCRGRPFGGWSRTGRVFPLRPYRLRQRDTHGIPVLIWACLQRFKGAIPVTMHREGAWPP